VTRVVAGVRQIGRVDRDQEAFASLCDTGKRPVALDVAPSVLPCLAVLVPDAENHVTILREFAELLPPHHTGRVVFPGLVDGPASRSTNVLISEAPPEFDGEVADLVTADSKLNVVLGEKGL
jgi:hypothetical protein